MLPAFLELRIANTQPVGTHPEKAKRKAEDALKVGTVLENNTLTEAEMFAELKALWGVNVNKINLRGETALMLACKALNEDMALLMVKHGANVEAKDNLGRNYEYFAMQHGEEKAKPLLQRIKEVWVARHLLVCTVRIWTCLSVVGLDLDETWNGITNDRVKENNPFRRSDGDESVPRQWITAINTITDLMGESAILYLNALSRTEEEVSISEERFKELYAGIGFKNAKNSGFEKLNNEKKARVAALFIRYRAFVLYSYLMGGECIEWLTSSEEEEIKPGSKVLTILVDDPTENTPLHVFLHPDRTTTLSGVKVMMDDLVKQLKESLTDGTWVSDLHNEMMVYKLLCEQAEELLRPHGE